MMSVKYNLSKLTAAVDMLADLHKLIVRMRGQTVSLICHPEATDEQILEASHKLREVVAGYRKTHKQVSDYYRSSPFDMYNTWKINHTLEKVRSI